VIVRTKWGQALLVLALAAGGVSPVAGQGGTARVKPGDRVFLRMWNTPPIPPSQDTITVNSDGQVPLPRLGLVSIGQLGPKAAEDAIRSQLAGKFNDPIEVLILGKIIVVGEVQQSGAFWVDGSASIREMIARAGGLNDAGDPRKVTLVRQGQSSRLVGWDSASGAVPLQSGDEIVVGRRPWWQTSALQLAGIGISLTSLIVSLRR
jgi:protein involved in polysaccharide export with SLBB domain